MPDSFGELEASSLFCPRCKRATPVRKKLLLVLPTGNKYDYTCSVCGTAVGGKTDSNSARACRSSKGAISSSGKPENVSPSARAASMSAIFSASRRRATKARVRAEALSSH